jgi:choline dehydrogenase-like flavoprotein
VTQVEQNNEFDLCVIGSGPAGMITALEYARRHPTDRVLLLEYGAPGGTGRNALDDSIRNMNPVNHHDPYECTNKGIGGTSTTWGGRCVMYDAADFEDRAVVRGGCTWDRTFFAEAEEFRGRAAEYFECGQAPFRLPESAAPIAEGFRRGDVDDLTLERWSMPTRFAGRYGRELEETANLEVRTESEARDFGRPDAHGAVRTLRVRNTRTGELSEVRARAFVIAAGTQESTRLLLRNPGLFERSGGVPDSLGRYYQGHVSGKIATVQFSGDPRKTDYACGQDPDGSYFRRRFRLADDVIVRENLLNAAIWLDTPLYHDPSHGNGAMSFIYLGMITPVLGKRLAPPAIFHSVTKGKVSGVGRHLLNVLKDLPGSVTVPLATFYRRYCVKRKLPGVYLFSPQNRYALHFHAEQLPDRDNRMALGPDGETLEIHYRYTDADVESVIRTHEKLDAWLRSCGCGYLEFWWPREELPAAIREMSKDGIHQSGTTRIGNSPESGTVDRNLRVWGTANVYVCSSSVLPTSGQANPTFFTGMLAVRLARHLGETRAQG